MNNENQEKITTKAELERMQKVELLKKIFRILLQSGYCLSFPKYFILDEEAFDKLEQCDIYEMVELFACDRYLINTESKFITGV